MKAVILAGGGGSRLWPLSTPDNPKQFQCLVSERTMLEETIERLDFLQPEDIFIAINSRHLDVVKGLCPAIPESNIIIEPDLRDTASCIGLAAVVIEKTSPGEVMCVIYADHLLKNKEAFQEKLKVAEKIAREEGTLNIVEVVATEPNTNYGYVEIGKMIKDVEGTEVYELKRFVEKPDFETAKEFVLAGNFLWNTGIYVCKTAVLLDKYRQHKLETYKKLMQISDAYGTPEQDAVIAEVYPTLSKISIDYAIMENLDPREVRIIKADLGWSDIGNWQAIWQTLSQMDEENVTRGSVKMLDSKGCLVYSDAGKQISVIGMEDTVIVDTPDGLLVSRKDQSKKIKDIF